MTNETMKDVSLESERRMDACIPKCKTRAKRDIFHFEGEKPTAINLEHVTNISIEGSKITFNFYSNAIFIELEDKEKAELIFKALLQAWSSDVLE